MSKNHDIDSTRQVVMRARNAGLGVKPGLVLAILQELEETRAKHRKEWGRAEAAEAAVSNQHSVVKTLAERNVELTKFKDAYPLQAQELEQAEAERYFRQKENKELFEQIERVRELAEKWISRVQGPVQWVQLLEMHYELTRALDGGEQE